MQDDRFIIKIFKKIVADKQPIKLATVFYNHYRNFVHTKIMKTKDIKNIIKQICEYRLPKDKWSSADILEFQMTVNELFKYEFHSDEDVKDMTAEKIFDSLSIDKKYRQRPDSLTGLNGFVQFSDYKLTDEEIQDLYDSRDEDDDSGSDLLP